MSSQERVFQYSVKLYQFMSISGSVSVDFNGFQMSNSFSVAFAFCIESSFVNFLMAKVEYQLLQLLLECHFLHVE